MTSAAKRFSSTAGEALRSSGWSPGRNVASQVEQWRAELAQPRGFEMSEAAKAVLTEFGGLHIEQHGRGEFYNREPFEFVPTLAIGEADRFARFLDKAGAALYPLGEASGGHLFLAIAPDGRVFVLMDEIWFLGSTIDDAIEALVSGRETPRL